jgi:hypothetical protein
VNRDSVQHSPTLEIGDKVQFKVIKIAGVVIAVDRYPDANIPMDLFHDLVPSFKRLESKSQGWGCGHG